MSAVLSPASHLGSASRFLFHMEIVDASRTRIHSERCLNHIVQSSGVIFSRSLSSLIFAFLRSTLLKYKADLLTWSRSVTSQTGTAITPTTIRRRGIAILGSTLCPSFSPSQSQPRQALICFMSRRWLLPPLELHINGILEYATCGALLLLNTVFLELPVAAWIDSLIVKLYSIVWAHCHLFNLLSCRCLVCLQIAAILNKAAMNMLVEAFYEHKFSFLFGNSSSTAAVCSRKWILNFVRNCYPVFQKWLNHFTFP